MANNQPQNHNGHPWGPGRNMMEEFEEFMVDGLLVGPIPQPVQPVEIPRVPFGGFGFPDIPPVNQVARAAAHDLDEYRWPVGIMEVRNQGLPPQPAHQQPPQQQIQVPAMVPLVHPGPVLHREPRRGHGHYVHFGNHPHHHHHHHHHHALQPHLMQPVAAAEIRVEVDGRRGGARLGPGVARPQHMPAPPQLHHEAARIPAHGLHQLVLNHLMGGMDVGHGHVHHNHHYHPIQMDASMLTADEMEIDERDVEEAMAVAGPSLPIQCEISEELSDLVFENDMLRELIFEALIFTNGKDTVCRDSVKNLRLVRKSWLHCVADILHKARLPLFQLCPNGSNSVEVPPFDDSSSSTLLGNFVQSMTTHAMLPDFIPPYSLKLMPDFFRKENYQNLSDCLVSCGSGLVDLDMRFPINSSMTLVFHSFFLPQLQRLSVEFGDQRLFQINQGAVIQNTGHTIYPLQTILNGTEELRELEFKHASTECLIPVGFEFLALPETITTLLIDCPMKGTDLHLLTRSNLPHLTSLRIFASNSNAYSDELMFQVLNKYRQTLHTLSLRGHQCAGSARNHTLFRFPMMEKLENLAVTAQSWELQEDLNHMEYHLPQLKDFRILNTNHTMFLKWTVGSIYSNVTKLCVSLINSPEFGLFHRHPYALPQTLNFTEERMQMIHLAFPNLIDLSITLLEVDKSGLQYMFREMRSLEKLALTVKGNREEYLGQQWDAVLIGLPIDMVTYMRDNRDYLNLLELNDDVNYPSIRRLTALKTLALVDNLYPSRRVDNLISDLAFYFAFFRMTNLKTLKLAGKFSASNEIRERWAHEKGTEICDIRIYG